jgi:prepilin-type processing-associated H-X9-DG protein
MNLTVTTTRVGLFLCPSSPTPSWNNVGTTAPLGQYRASGNSYFASLGSTLEFAGNQNNAPPNGVFMYHSAGYRVGIADIQDGTSSTVAFSEWKIGTGTLATVTLPSDIIFFGRYPTGVTRNSAGMVMPAGGAALNQWLQECTAFGRTGGGRFGKTPTLGSNWSMGLTGYTMGMMLVPPDGRFFNCSIHASGTIENPGAMNPGSYHPGGCMILMCDGAVRFLKGTVSQPVVWALASRNQAEVLTSDAY